MTNEEQAMRIHCIELRNFRCFERQTLELHPQFTLLVGDNGSGKTTLLDALAVAAGIWLVRVPDTTLASSRRPIRRDEIRLVPVPEGDRSRFVERRPVIVAAEGWLCGQSASWQREIWGDNARTSNKSAAYAIGLIREAYDRIIQGGEHLVVPILSYYGAGRNWLPEGKRHGAAEAKMKPARRWDAFYDCLTGRVRRTDLRAWVQREYLARVDRQGRWRPGFQAVKRAVLGCIPSADDLTFDWDRLEVVLSIDGTSQPLSSLSAGQQAMLGMVADIAIRAVTQNAFLLPPDELGPKDDPLPRVLRETPGVVLIDELDVHLHPKWQRRVADDLKRTFPSMQFVCTSHSPQVIGEVPSEQIRLLPEKPGDPIQTPSMSLGADSNWILKVLMGGEEVNGDVGRKLAAIYRLISDRDIDEAKLRLRGLRAEIGVTEPIQRATSIIERMELLGR